MGCTKTYIHRPSGGGVRMGGVPKLTSSVLLGPGVQRRGGGVRTGGVPKLTSTVLLGPGVQRRGGGVRMGGVPGKFK